MTSQAGITVQHNYRPTDAHCSKVVGWVWQRAAWRTGQVSVFVHVEVTNLYCLGFCWASANNIGWYNFTWDFIAGSWQPDTASLGLYFLTDVEKQKALLLKRRATTDLATQHGAYRIGNIEYWGLEELLWHDFPQILRVSWWVAVMAILWCDDKTSRSEVTVWMSLDRAGMSPHQHRCWQARCVVTTGAPQTPSIGKHQYIWISKAS